MLYLKFVPSLWCLVSHVQLVICLELPHCIRFPRDTPEQRSQKRTRSETSRSATYSSNSNM